ncbi:hypothetical protein SOASR030_25380 [Leminorella grimontii]|uniref:Uncharacterized protein n=1 Tax=Leminorella grimontii TaxID=82981 RepID=A0AAV5N2U5_9GAMM|nr:hypothetical protein [Leminorella grimontii]KFC94684.1 hypothetical protein GLGR_2445 [Leminorella grimontii ATCC 33999 = DSM 5078]GKX56426.1 hypothetical protein SOASR030_25380 [Leminorella grimontii]VFS61281.1 Uncharacterised protein [Leminorella grimontii]
MDEMTVLEKAHREYADLLALPPLEDVRAAIKRAYEDGRGSASFFFAHLPEFIEPKFVKKMFYKSDFIWPMIFGFAFAILSIFNLFSGKGGLHLISIGRFSGDAVFLFILSMALLTSSFPCFVDSFNANMLERRFHKSYFRRLVEFLACFLLISSIVTCGALFMGLTRVAL